MKKESPIYVEDIYFCSFSSDEIKQYSDCPHMLSFDRRHDFLIDSSFAGIAAKVDLGNDRYCTSDDRGVRRRISITLVDHTSRCELATRYVKVNMPKDNPYKTIYELFPADEIDFRSEHTYGLVVCDETASTVIDEQIFHVYGQRELGMPADWYTVDCCGVRPDWKDSIYRSVDIERGDLNARFNVAQNFGNKVPKILPELEIRLYYPDGDIVNSRFIEPQCIDFRTNLYFAEYPFFSTNDHPGVFYAEILCMEYPLAGFVFKTVGREESGQWFGDDIEPLEEYSAEAAAARYEKLMPSSDSKDVVDEFEAALDRFIAEEGTALCCDAEETTSTSKDDTDKPDTDTALLASLDHLTGLRSVKEKLTVYERMVRFNKMRADKGFPVMSVPLHAMFLGSPGTGKTTVAKMMGIMLRRAGILSKGHVVTRERATLLGQNYNSESEKTLAAIEEAQGGILLIDEAYQLYQPNDPRDPGKFVIETLLTALSDESKRDWMLVLAGYPKEMKRMFDMNPGFKSRIPESNIYVFDDFTEPELLEIAEKYIERYKYSLSPEARTALSERLKSDYSGRDRNFGNARHVINIIQTEILPSMAVRVTSEGSNDEKSLINIIAADIPPRPLKEQIASPCRVGFSTN